MRPLYLNIQDNVNGHFSHNDQGFPKLHSSHGITTLSHYAEPLNQTWPVSQGKLSSRKLAILEPLDYQYQNGLFKMYNTISTPPPHHPHVSINPGNLPPLDWRQQTRWIPDEQYEQQKILESHRTSKWSRKPDDTHRRRIIGDSENGLKPVLARQSKYSGQANGHAAPVPSSTPQPARFVSPVPSPRGASPLAPSSPAPQPEQDVSHPHVPSSQTLQVEDLSGDSASASEEPLATSRPHSQPREADPGPTVDQVDALTVPEERLSTPPPTVSPPPAIAEETEPETTQSEEIAPQGKPPTSRSKIAKSNGKQRSSNRSFRKENTIDRSSPDIPPFDNPKDALNRSLQQLQHPEWEVTILGLQSLVRLIHNHSNLLHTSLHQVVVAVTKHVRNLRSQVARVACKAATHLFTSLGRGIENEMDDLCAVLLTRTADTNKFLRADCNTALDAMVDHVSSSKSVASIVNKGAKHQNAVVRATACRLLLRLCERLGPERALSLPRDTRDAILNTGARSLTEGSLDTRRYAKEMFILLSQDPRLLSLLQEVVPTSIMRSIGKVLARLTAK